MRLPEPAVVARRTRQRLAAARRFLAPLFDTRLSRFCLAVVAIYLLVALVGPMLPIADPYSTQTTASGEYVRLQPPSGTYLFGTTSLGYSVLSQFVHSFRTSVLIGLSTAAVVLFIGINVGIISGYYGGRIETVLMGITDVAYGLPLYPLALVVLALFEPGNATIVLVIGIVVWRSVARVIRSETLSIKERQFIKASRASGSGDLRIMYSHILPNLIPVIVVYFVFGVIWGVILEAGLSFIGLGDPEAVSWGIMLHEVFRAAVFSEAWWWVLPPALALWLFIFSLFVISRAIERNVEISSSGSF